MKTNVRRDRLLVKTREEGSLRYELYKSAFERINESIEKGFYLEAIALIESLIADRLESRALFLNDLDASFKTLGQLNKKIQKLETDSTLQQLVSVKAEKWWEKRNHALHEAVKIEAGDTRDWLSRQAEFKNAAQEGQVLLKEIRNRIEALRRKNK